VTWEMEEGEYVQNHNIAFASTWWEIDGPAISTGTVTTRSSGATRRARW
jgi:hypothetical protein